VPKCLERKDKEIKGRIKRYESLRITWKQNLSKVAELPQRIKYAEIALSVRYYKKISVNIVWCFNIIEFNFIYNVFNRRII
jgi:hypothetical protein